MSIETVKPFRCSGYWWLPETPDERIAGTLTYTPQKGATLELFGSFAQATADFAGFGPEIVWGESDHGVVTLHDCVLTHLSVGSTNNSRLRARNVFLGYHFASESDMNFEKLFVRYSNLDEWINRSGFDRKVLADSVLPPWKKLTVIYEPPNAIQIAQSPDCNMAVEFHLSVPSLTYVQKKASILQENYVELTFPSLRSVRDCFETLFHLRNFLTLGISEPIYVLQLRGYVQDCAEPITIFFEQRYMPEQLETILPPKMLFIFDEIAAKSDTFLKNWYSKRVSLKNAYELFFALINNPHMYADDRFLSMSRALESYHKEVIYSKDRNLRVRLTEILNIFWSIANTFIQDKGAFLNTVMDTRNYLTHYDVKPKKNVVYGNALFFTAEQLRLLVEMCLLKEIGFTLDEIERLFVKNDNHQQLIRLISEQTT